VNIILFEVDETSRPLPRQDPRARHILDVLQRIPGESLDVGLIDGPRGKAVVKTVTEIELVLSFSWEKAQTPPEMVTLIAGLCRPQTSRRVLREAATLGVARMFFVCTDRGERTYADSSLWSTGEYERHVRTGVEQAFATRLPTVEIGMDLQTALTDAGGHHRIALDNYEGIMPLHRVPLTADTPLVLAVGSERGWSAAERDLLRAEGYQLAGLGSRVLRTETAVIAALAVIKAATGAWDTGPTVDTREECQ
jgi:16S rRNA (uracil1498-N3)-methyltransferase